MTVRMRLEFCHVLDTKMGLQHPVFLPNADIVVCFQPWFSLGALATTGFAAGYVLNPTVSAEGFEIHPPHNHWPHSGLFQALDHAR